MSQASMVKQRFGRLLSAGIKYIATIEGKSEDAVAQEFGLQMGLATETIQRYKYGNIPREKERIDYLAREIVRRTDFNRGWLREFLQLAAYPQAQQLIEELYPAVQDTPKAARVFNNLSRAPYHQFVMREEAYNELLEGLNARTPLVVISGMGGMGKTSLAREVAGRSLNATPGFPQFDAVVWWSDKESPGTTILSLILDEIARTLDYPGVTQHPYPERKREVEQLMRGYRVLLVIDNFGTVTDEELLHWLLHLPEPSKAVVTTREFRKLFNRGAWSMELLGMNPTEAELFMLQYWQSLKNRKKRDVLEPAIVDTIYRFTGGNPKAIEITLGLLQYNRGASLAAINEYFQAKRVRAVTDPAGNAGKDLFDDLFDRSWSVLNRVAQNVLLSISVFRESADDEALSEVAGLVAHEYDDAIMHLTDLSLLTALSDDTSSSVRYTLHPLVQLFAERKSREVPDFIAKARQRWIDYYYTFIISLPVEGWDNREQFDRVEPHITNINAVIDQCVQLKLWNYPPRMVEVLKSFWGTRGDYQTRSLYVGMALIAAEQSGDERNQVRLLCIQARSLCYESKPVEAEAKLAEAEALYARMTNQDPGLIPDINLVRIRIHLLCGEFERIRPIAEQNIALAERYGWMRKVIYQYDIADYYRLTGQYDEAERLLNELIPKSLPKYRRIPIRGWIALAEIMLAKGNFEQAERYLEQAHELARELQHRNYLSSLKRLRAQVALVTGDIVTARSYLEEAADDFKRLGMQPELEETMRTLDNLAAV